MKRFGRKHRSFFRICATNSRQPRDGEVLEELGTYDPMVPDTDARALLDGERIKYWLSVGAQPSDKVRVLIKKYGLDGTHVAAQTDARARLAMPKVVPPAPPLPEPPKKPEPEAVAEVSDESGPTDAAEAAAAEPAAEEAAG
ncbi:MAG: 30S ribosomal protein S16 [Pirellulales bacterium]|nr:30S ribosomal protein S16 [Pirellulales bacterium]